LKGFTLTLVKYEPSKESFKIIRNTLKLITY
jgi:hypothetical protein